MKSLLILLIAFISLSASAQRLVHIDEETVGLKSLKDLQDAYLISNQDTITIFKQVNADYWSAYYKGETIFIKYWYIKELSEDHDQTAHKKAVLASQNRKANIIKKYGSVMGNLILKGRVRIGMTKAMARLSWGEPSDINTTTTAYSTHEQWVYSVGNYLYFENGKLTAIQN